MTEPPTINCPTCGGVNRDRKHFKKDCRDCATDGQCWRCDWCEKAITETDIHCGCFVCDPHDSQYTVALHDACHADHMIDKHMIDKHGGPTCREDDD